MTSDTDNVIITLEVSDARRDTYKLRDALHCVLLAVFVFVVVVNIVERLDPRLANKLLADLPHCQFVILLCMA